jgi:hypothetical protein
MFFLIPSRQMPEYHLRLGERHFLPNDFHNSGQFLAPLGLSPVPIEQEVGVVSPADLQPAVNPSSALSALHFCSCMSTRH